MGGDMTPVADILHDASRCGIELRADGDRIRFRPANKMPPTLANRLRNHKAAILALLSVTPVTVTNTPAGDPVAGGFGVGDTGDTRKTKPERLVCNACCKRCGAAIAWGELIEVRDSMHPQGRKPTNRDKRWVALDKEYHPHGCVAGAKRSLLRKLARDGSDGPRGDDARDSHPPGEGGRNLWGCNGVDRASRPAHILASFQRLPGEGRR